MVANFYLLKSFRIFLFPFSLLAWVYIKLRNWLYDKGILKSVPFNLPVICIGNVSVGGTGKSPMVEYLVRMLQQDYKVATLSRGYKRKTKGYALATPATTALEIGDEPMQFHLKFPDIAVAVGEQRLEAIPQLLHDRPETNVILLDDAFQHRAIRAGLNILLTDYNNLYTQDWYLPTGDLRDNKSSARRANIIVVTKCPANMTEADRNRLLGELKPTPMQSVFFSCINYRRLYHIESGETFTLSHDCEVLLMSGIANPRALKHYIDGQVKAYTEKLYSDHHIFTIDDLKDIKEKWSRLQGNHKIIVTTEKDAVRLLKFREQLADLPLYVLPVEHQIKFGEEEKFRQIVLNFIQSFPKTASPTPPKEGLLDGGDKSEN
jgi:tetraacyldisaccharide 4'-kinase